MDFVTSLTFLLNWKNNSYDVTLIIVNELIKMVQYILIKTIINIASLVKVIMNNMIKYYGLSNLIISDWDLLFISES